MCTYKKFLVFCFAVFIFSPPSVSSGRTGNNGIFISEIASFEASDYEWIEIYNAGSSSIDMQGWKFVESGVKHGLAEFRGGMKIPAGTFAVIANKAEKLATRYPDYKGTLIDSSWSSLKESGEEIGLEDSNGNSVELFIYPATSEKTDSSLERETSNSGWIESPGSHTMGGRYQENVLPPPTATPEIQRQEATTRNPTSRNTNLPVSNIANSDLENLLKQFSNCGNFNFEISGSFDFNSNKTTGIKNSSGAAKSGFQNGDISEDIKISELMPAPASDSNDEWIEIFNSGGRAVNMGNWKLTDSSAKTTYLMSDEIMLQPGEYLLFAKSETHIALNNGSDEVKLFDYDGGLRSQVEYSDAKSGQSLALIEIEGEEEIFDWTPDATPGTANPSFERLTGKILEDFIDGNFFFYIEGNSGQTFTVNFSAEILDPQIADITIKKDSTVDLLAKRINEKSFQLKKIFSIKPPYNSQQTTSRKNYYFYLLASIFICICLLILLFKIRKRRKNGILRVSRRLEKENFDKDENLKR